MNCKIDIVAHSMGFAYALGMTEFLKTKILPDANGYYFGRFYILAPENGCSAPPFNLSDFEEIWQYGSNEEVDIDYRQDGVAPQCAVPGIDWEPQVNIQNIPAYGRVPFQGKNEHEAVKRNRMIISHANSIWRLKTFTRSVINKK